MKKGTRTGKTEVSSELNVGENPSIYTKETTHEKT